MIYSYNRLSTKVVGPRPTVLTPSPSLIQVAEALAVWLVEHRLPMGPYLASCFALHNWAWAPKLKKLTEPRYQKHYFGNEVEAALWWRQQEMERQAREPIDLPVGREIVKARFRHMGLEKACRAQPDLSGGFNPRSGHCSDCPEREGCRAADHNANSRVKRSRYWR